MHRLLLGHFGPRGWWPGDSPAEVAVGALLTQSVAWTNAQTAVARLKEATALSFFAMREIPREALEEALRPSRFFRQKARRLLALADLVEDDAGGSLDLFLARPWTRTRPALLGLGGVGEETADAILAYAAGAPVFVVDAYARRVLGRVGLDFADDRAMREAVVQALPETLELQEFHALIDALGHRICRPEPLCTACPLVAVCATGRLATLGGKARREFAREQGRKGPQQEETAHDSPRPPEGADRGRDRTRRQTAGSRLEGPQRARVRAHRRYHGRPEESEGQVNV